VSFNPIVDFVEPAFPKDHGMESSSFSSMSSMSESPRSDSDSESDTNVLLQGHLPRSGFEPPNTGIDEDGHDDDDDQNLFDCKPVARKSRRTGTPHWHPGSSGVFCI